jgi:Fic family protein
MKDISDPLIKAALSHYQFEMIHPFEVYNGVIGRLLTRKILLNADIKGVHYLALSEALYESKNDYFDILSSTQRSGGYIRWIKYFVHAIGKSAQISVERMVRYQRIVRQDRDIIMSRELPRTDNILVVFEYWKQLLISSVSQSAKDLNLSYNTVERIVNILQDLGILAQATIANRKKEFIYMELFNLY